MKSISSNTHIIIVGVVYGISLVFFDNSPAFRIFHCVFDETENSLFQMALICGICLLMNLAHAPSVLYIITACLAPYGLISALIVIGTSTWGFAVNLSAFITLPVLHFIMKGTRPEWDSTPSISRKTLYDIAEEFCELVSWAIFPIYIILTGNLIYLVIVYII